MINYSDYCVEKVNNFREFYKRIKNYRDLIAFIDNDVEITYSEFCDDIDKAIEWLSSDSEYILINVKNKYLFSVAYFATILSGNIACLTPCSEEILYCYSKFKFGYILTDPLMKEALSKGRRNLVKLKSANKIITVLCSSGTTDKPKAIALTETNILSDLIAGMEKYEFPEGGVYVSILPYYHAYGLVCDLLAPLYSSSTICLTDDLYNFFTALKKYNPTALNLTPSIIELIIQRLSQCKKKEEVVGSRLKKILSGGAGTAKNLCERMKKYDINIYGCYGLSECSPCVSVNRDNYYMYGSAGIPLDCNKVNIDGSGRIVVKGTNVMAGYLDVEGNLIEELNGEYITNDIGCLVDGLFFVLGRQDDIIVLPSGEKILPANIEYKINSIEGVQESIVYLQDGVLTALIVCGDDTIKTDIEKTIRGNIFENNKIRRIIFSDQSLLRNNMGKLKRDKYGEKNNI